MTSWWWFLTRATGIVAVVLALASLTFGLTFSARNTGDRHRPNWWMAMHRWLGGLTLAFTVGHVVAAYLDTDSGLRLVDLVLPSTAAGWAIGWGVVALWLFVAVTVPSVARVRRQIPRRVWHVVHLLAIPAFALSIVHAYQAGSDATQSWLLMLLATVGGSAAYPLVLRLLTRRGRRPRRATTPTLAGELS